MGEEAALLAHSCGPLRTRRDARWAIRCSPSLDGMINRGPSHYTHWMRNNVNAAQASRQGGCTVKAPLTAGLKNSARVSSSNSRPSVADRVKGLSKRIDFKECDHLLSAWGACSSNPAR